MTKPNSGFSGSAGDRKWQTRLLPRAVILVLAVPLLIPFLAGGAQVAHDRLVPFMRLAAIQGSISDGFVPPGWFSQFDGGYGSPYPSFYAMGFYYLALVPRAMGFGLGTSVEAASAITIIAAAMAMYELAQDLFGHQAGIAAAILYVYSPYFLSDMFVRGAYSEMYSFVWFPLILLSIRKMFEARARSGFALGALSIAGLLSAHNLMSFVFLPPLALVSLIAVWKSPVWGRSKARRVAYWLSVWAVAGLLAAYLWLPIAFNRGFIHTDYFLGFDFAGDFIGFRTLMSVPGTHELTTSVGPILLGASSLALIAAVVSKRTPRRGWILLCGGLGLGYLFLTNHRSNLIWEVVPLLEFVQFPWRMLAPASFLLALTASSIGAIAPNGNSRAIAAAALILPAIFISRDLIALPEREPVQNMGGESICQEVWGTQDYRPVWSKAAFWRGPNPPDTSPQGYVLKPCADLILGSGGPNAAITVQSRTEQRIVVSYSSPSRFVMTLSQYYYPGWAASVDGESISINVQQGTGLIQVHLPAGNHLLSLSYNGTVAQRLGGVASMLGVPIFLLGLALAPREQAASQGRSLSRK